MPGSIRTLITDTPDVCASVISLFELLQKQRVGKLVRDLDILGEIFINDFKLETLDKLVLNAYRQLPKLGWKDPFDHLLMAQAIASGACLITADQQILVAAVPGLKTLAAHL